MKQSIYCLWAFIAFTYSTTAQDFTSSYEAIDNTESQIEYALSPLYMAPVTSGILQDRTLPLGNSDLWIAGSAYDNIYCHMKQLSVQYDGILGARLPSATPLTSAENAF
jgi:hypothetical protein